MSPRSRRFVHGVRRRQISVGDDVQPMAQVFDDRSALLASGPQRGAVVAALRELAGPRNAIARRHWMYLDLVAYNIPHLAATPTWYPRRWENVDVLVLDVADVCVAKLGRWSANDRGGVSRMVVLGELGHASLVVRFRALVDRLAFDGRAEDLPIATGFSRWYESTSRWSRHGRRAARVGRRWALAGRLTNVLRRSVVARSGRDARRLGVQHSAEPPVGRRAGVPEYGVRSRRGDVGSEGIMTHQFAFDVNDGLDGRATRQIRAAIERSGLRAADPGLSLVMRYFRWGGLPTDVAEIQEFASVLHRSTRSRFLATWNEIAAGVLDPVMVPVPPARAGRPRGASAERGAYVIPDAVRAVLPELLSIVPSHVLGVASWDAIRRGGVGGEVELEARRGEAGTLVRYGLTQDQVVRLLWPLALARRPEGGAEDAMFLLLTDPWLGRYPIVGVHPTSKFPLSESILRRHETLPSLPSRRRVRVATSEPPCVSAPAWEPGPTPSGPTGEKKEEPIPAARSASKPAPADDGWDSEDAEW